MSHLLSLFEQCRSDFDITDPHHHKGVNELAAMMLGDSRTSASDSDLRLSCQHPDAPIEFKLAAKIAESRRFMRTIKQPVKIGIVYAMWGERSRLQPRSDINPTGEDSLRVKLDQLNWVTEQTPVQWTLYPVDDGCPEDSADLASSIAALHPTGKHVNVLRLAEHLPASEGPLRNLQSADDSRKAGAIFLGCQKALADGVDAVVYTDADNSVHMGQLGLLLKPWLMSQKEIVLGNRKHPDSLLVKSSDRWGPGIKVLRHMQRMIGDAIFSLDIKDTQAAFKLYDRQVVSQIIEDPTVFDFSFDTDWIASAIHHRHDFAQVPFAFIDSEAESASSKQNPMTTWETLLLGLLKSIRRYELFTSNAARDMATLIDEEIKDYRDLELLIDAVPTELEDAGELDFGNPDIMSVDALRQWIGERRLFEQAQQAQ